ncbi:hypothetical protein UlMin_004166 [Ulmus minor]
MAGPSSSFFYSLSFTLQEMYRGKLASTELFTILEGFISSLLFLVLLTIIGNFQETRGSKTEWGAVVIAEVVALIASNPILMILFFQCSFLFSAVLLYEVNKLSGTPLFRS